MKFSLKYNIPEIGKQRAGGVSQEYIQQKKSLLRRGDFSARKKGEAVYFILTPIPRSSSVPGTRESQKAAQIPATAMGVFRMAQIIPPTVWIA